MKQFVNTMVGTTGKINDMNGQEKIAELSQYTSNWSGTMEPFLSLNEFTKGTIKAYQKAFDTMLTCMKKYPLHNNRWGPFFEDFHRWSDTQIDAVTFDQFLMNHPEYFPNWKVQVQDIFN